MEKKQTAVEWLESQINLGLSERGLISAIKEARQMEKEQIERAYTRGDVDSFGRIHHPEHYQDKSSEQYYNETYGGGE
jgi:hypothetical protein